MLLRAIREYFHRENVTEVVTPLLRPFGSSEVHLDNIVLDQGYLQTSPEYGMKCLLAETGQSIYQICSAFRAGEAGERHRIEFQMLEWYRVGYRLTELRRELEALLASIDSMLAEAFEIRRIRLPLRCVSYQSLFRERYGVCPHTTDDNRLRQLAETLPAEHLADDARRADLLDTLFSQGIELQLQEATLVYDFPACQSALAERHADDQGCEVANRFELYLGGLEIANAYQELTDADELRCRFAENNAIRSELGKPPVPDDPELLDAMTTMPACAGIALGIDRLLMALLSAPDIGRV